MTPRLARHLALALVIGAPIFACARDVGPSAAPAAEPVEPPTAEERAPEAALVPTRVRDAVALGDCGTALELLPADPSDAERLVAARCHLEAKRPDEALAVLPEGALDDPLAPYAAWYRAQALEQLGRGEEAAEALTDLALPGAAGLRVRLQRARLQQDREALRGLVSSEVGAEARYHLALIEADREAALLDVWARAEPPWDAMALDALGIETPDPADPAQREAMRGRVEALQRRNRNEEALALLDRLGETRPPEVPTDHLELARARFAAREYPAALESWEAALGAPAEAEGRPSDLFDYALTWARTDDYDTAAVVYRRLMAQHPATDEADFASFKLGYMAYDRGNCDDAVALLRTHRTERPDSSHYDEATWFEARCHWRSGDLDAAEEAWEALIARRPGSSLAAGAHYWLARVAGQRGDADAQRAGLARVLERYPDTGYAWFAAERLGRTFEARPAAEPPAWPADLAEDLHVVRAEALTEAGLRDLARAELAEVRADGREGKLALAWARIAAGDYRGGQRLARPWCGNPWEPGDPVAQQACWPRPEHDLVDAVVARHPLEPLLPYAIMSAESALSPGVTSPAGARGLMQLMPEVAHKLHDEVFADERFDPERLYAGPYNATLGSWELGLRSRSLEGVLDGSDLPAVIASYNAGEEAVERWIEEAGAPLEPDVFAEDIEYTETRRYVKRVLGFLMAWRYVYGDLPPEADAATEPETDAG